MCAVGVLLMLAVYRNRLEGVAHKASLRNMVAGAHTGVQRQSLKKPDANSSMGELGEELVGKESVRRGPLHS